MENADERQFEAAQFLAEQISLIQDERKGYAVENDSLHIQIQQLISEIERIKAEMDYYAQLFDVSVLDLSNRSGSSGNIILRL